MDTTWILVCDSAKARVFETHGADPRWHVESEVSHEGSRSKAADLVSDRQGSRSSEGRSVHHNALAPASSPKEVEKEHFAHLLGQKLDVALRSARFGRWVLVAPPHFAGLMMKELTPQLKKHLLATVDKDLGHLDPVALEERLRDVVRVPSSEQGAIGEPSKHRRH
jgi:protein required for attachment to host cells